MNSKKKILVVDDDPMIRWTLSEALQQWGYELTEADSTTKALEIVQQDFPDIMLLDINLPDGSGLELLRNIKQAHPQTFVIMMTGEVIVENTISALRGGADDFIGKPVSLEELQFALKQAEQNKRRNTLTQQLPRLLIVTDSQLQADHLMVALGVNDIDVTIATIPEELQRASEEEHDIVLVDVEASELRGILATLRASPVLAEIPILVEISRLALEPSLAGVMPQYRAMPCSPTELVSLTRRRIASMSTKNADYDFAGMRPML
ncbi:MAG: response regulator [Acidobacteria bacterium]|nr:response regulator [Acidobacteriota bacterium]